MKLISRLLNLLVWVFTFCLCTVSQWGVYNLIALPEKTSRIAIASTDDNVAYTDTFLWWGTDLSESLDLGNTGKVTAVYNATVTSQSIKTSDRSLSDLYSVYDDAISSIQAGTLKASDGSTINLADSDNNNDNFIDSPTFITNVYDDRIWDLLFGLI